MLKFNAETTRQLEIAYAGADVTARRRASFDAVNPCPGETIVDIGCGNGMLTAELARAVGPTGRVFGVDPSVDMRRVGETRCEQFDWVDLREGLADALPIKDGIADKAVSVQVFEYIPDIPAAVREAHRILRPGGRLVIGDIHFDSLVWHSDNPARMQRMIEAWDGHFTERRVPALLPPILRDAGFVLDKVTPMTLCDPVMRPDGLATMMITLMSAFARSKSALPAHEITDWVEEQHALARDQRFFFSLTHFVTSALRV